MRWFSGPQTFSLSLQIRCLPRTDILQEKSYEILNAEVPMYGWQSSSDMGLLCRN